MNLSPFLHDCNYPEACSPETEVAKTFRGFACPFLCHAVLLSTGDVAQCSQVQVDMVIALHSAMHHCA